MPPAAKVRAVPPPPTSSLSPSYKSAYFIDSYAVTLPPPRLGLKAYSPDALARAQFSHPPAWFAFLMWLRDRIVSVWGVKTSTRIRGEAVGRGVETVYVFPVVARLEREVVVGEDDGHLDFRASVLVRDVQKGGGVQQEMVTTTVVHCHGWFGRMYLMLIRPFHVLIVRYSLARVPGRLVGGFKDE